MPAFPWKTFASVDSDHEYLVMASILPLKSYWRVPFFLRLTMAIRGQLAQADGALRAAAESAFVDALSLALIVGAGIAFAAAAIVLRAMPAGEPALARRATGEADIT